MLKFYLNHRRFIVVVSFDQPPSLGPSIWRNKHRDISLDRDINKDRDISVCLFTFLFDFVEEIHRGFVEERERERDEEISSSRRRRGDRQRPGEIIVAESSRRRRGDRETRGDISADWSRSLQGDRETRGDISRDWSLSHHGGVDREIGFV